MNDEEICREVRETLAPMLYRISRDPSITGIRIQLEAEYPPVRAFPLRISIRRAGSVPKKERVRVPLGDIIETLLIAAGIVGAFWLFARTFL